MPDVGQVKTVKDVLPGLTSSASGSTHSGPGKKVEKFKSSIREVSSPLSKLKSPNKLKPSISSRDMLSPYTFKLYTDKLFKLYTDNDKISTGTRLQTNYQYYMITVKFS